MKEPFPSFWVDIWLILVADFFKKQNKTEALIYDCVQTTMSRLPKPGSAQAFCLNSCFAPSKLAEIQDIFLFVLFFHFIQVTWGDIALMKPTLEHRVIFWCLPKLLIIVSRFRQNWLIKNPLKMTSVVFLTELEVGLELRLWLSPAIVLINPDGRKPRWS